jgi:hypothetical protein
LELGENEKAMLYFLLAHEKYHEWGALGKRDSLFNFVESIFAPASTNARYLVLATLILELEQS